MNLVSKSGLSGAARLLAIVGVCLSGAASCNSITGADELSIGFEGEEFDRSDDPGSHSPAGPDDEDPVDSSTSSGDPGGSGGAGGAHSASATAATTATSAAATTSAQASTSSGGQVCQYPTGSYGVTMGKVLSGTLAWQGYAENSASVSNIAITDYYDCDGSLGINAILMVTSAAWCGPCQDEANDISYELPNWQSMGIRVVTLMIEDAYGYAASTTTAKSWRDNFGLSGQAVVADPNFSLGGSGSVGLPLQIIVDPRTMQVVDRQEGFSGSYSTLLNLANANGS